MRAWDFTLTAPHRSGSLATLGEAFGIAGVNIEGICGYEHEGAAVFHVLVTDRDREATRGIVEKFKNVGFSVRSEREVIMEQIDNRPGVLGECARRIADEDVNLTTIYLATDTRLVLGAPDLGAIERAWAKTMDESRR